MMASYLSDDLTHCKGVRSLTRSVTHLSLAVILLSASCSTHLPRPVPEKNAADARAHYNRGKALFDDIAPTDPSTRDFGKAIAEFNRAIRLEPGYAEAYRDRGYAYFYAGKNARAIEDYSQAIRLDLKTTLHGPSPYLLRGFSWVYERKYEKAIEDYNRIIDLEPENAVAWYNRGIAYKLLGKEARAKADMDKGRELGFQD